MTIAGIIGKIKQTKPHAYNDDTIVSYVNMLEQQVQTNVIQTEDRVTYQLPDDADTPLLIDGAFESCYLFFVCAMVDLNQQEMVSYDHNMGLFNALWDEYTKWYVRTHEKESTRISNFW